MHVKVGCARADRLRSTMVVNLKHCSKDLGAMTAQEDDALLACARSLLESPVATTGRALRGKNICLLSTPNDHPGAALVLEAATALGAHVARVPPTMSASSSADEVRHTSHLLGRLYDAVACDGLPSELVRRIAASANVPVFDSIAGPDHVVARLTDRLGDNASAQDNQRLMIQALLLCTLA
jgi:ornithine carbamoyltransferase